MLSKTTEYAIRSMVYIYIQNMKGGRPGFKEIARNIDSPEGFTGKVLQIITRAGLVSSIKGRGGGFFFDISGKPLTLLDVINVTEGQEFFHKCGFGLKSCRWCNGTKYSIKRYAHLFMKIESMRLVKP